jgi:hypothetical protein
VTRRAPSPLWPALTLLAALGACDGGEDQAPACEQYTACIRSLDELAGVETNLDRFDPGGACWGSEESAKACERACTRGLDWERRRRTDPPPSCE